MEQELQCIWCNPRLLCLLFSLFFEKSGGKTGLHFAAERGELEIVQLILEFLETFQKQHPSFDAQAFLCKKDNDGLDAYDHAFLHSNNDVCSLLSSHLKLPDQKRRTDPLSKEEKAKIERDLFEQRAQRISQIQQQSQQEERQKILDQYKPLHPDIFKLSDDFFVDSFLNARRADTDSALLSILKKETDGLYSFDLFTPEFCR